MKELSLHVLDIAENGIRAGASLVQIHLTEKENLLTIRIQDNGSGISTDILARLSDPFFTTRTTRSVGLGIPLYRLSAEQTGGTLEIHSDTDKNCHGTTVTATFYTDHLDCPPLGDIISTIVTLIQGSPHIDFLYAHRSAYTEVELDTRTIRAVLGDEIPLSTPEVLTWIRTQLTDQYLTKK